jgi:hypothetical protein
VYVDPDMKAVDIYGRLRKKRKNICFANRTIFLRYVDLEVKPFVLDLIDFVKDLEKFEKAVLQTKEQQKDIFLVAQKMNFILNQIQDEKKKIYSAQYYTEDRFAIVENNVANLKKEYKTCVDGISLVLKEDKEKVFEYSNIIDSLNQEMHDFIIDLEACKKRYPNEKSALSDIENELSSVEEQIAVMQNLIGEAQMRIKNGDTSQKQKELIVEIGVLGNQVAIAIDNMTVNYKKFLYNMEEREKQQVFVEAKNKEREQKRNERRKRRRAKRRDVAIVSRGIGDQEVSFNVLAEEIRIIDILKVAWEFAQEMKKH